MCSRTTWSRPRPGVFEAKATKFCPRGVLEVEASHSRTPIPGLFFTARRYAESGYAKSSVCPSFSNSTPYCRLLCACVWSIYGIESFTYHTHKFNVKNKIKYQGRASSKPRPGIFEAKVRGLRGQGHKILSSRSRPVLEDPIPDHWYVRIVCAWFKTLKKANSCFKVVPVKVSVYCLHFLLQPRNTN